MSLANAARSMNKAKDRLHAGTAAVAGRSVFVSYARLDRPFAVQLVTFLKSRGYDVWWDDRIEAGDFFDDRIIEALDLAFAVIVIWSAHSIRSRWVRWEATQGLRQDKLVPLIVPALDLRDIMPPFSALNTLRLGDDAQLLAALKKRGACCKR